jgi:hypothetical protein
MLLLPDAFDNDGENIPEYLLQRKTCGLNIHTEVKALFISAWWVNHDKPESSGSASICVS